MSVEEYGFKRKAENALRSYLRKIGVKSEKYNVSHVISCTLPDAADYVMLTDIKGDFNLYIASYNDHTKRWSINRYTPSDSAEFDDMGI